MLKKREIIVTPHLGNSSFQFTMWSFRRAVAPITKSMVHQPRVRMMSNDSIGGLYRSFGNASSFYNANKGVLKSAAGTLAVFAAFGLGYYFEVPVMPPLEPAADSVLRAFEEGRGLEQFDDGEMVDRKDLMDGLGPILQPKKSKSYVVIVGENGTGKTTAVKRELFALDIPKGAVYFNCPIAAGQFSIKLASLVEFRDQLDVSGGAQRRIESKTKEENDPDPKDEPLATFTILMQPLVDAAAKFKAKNGRPMVLVIDSVDRLAKKNPDFLGELQDFAKDCADDGNLRIVFISSDGSALPLLMARSSWSRADDPYEIGKIPDDQAVKFLMMNGIPEDIAKRAVANLTGGLFGALNKFVTSSSKGRTYEQLAEQRDRALRERLIDSKIPIRHALFQHLAKNKSVGTDDARDLGMKKAQLEGLLKDNILAVHPNKTYTFHDRHTATWFGREVKKTAWWSGW